MPKETKQEYHPFCKWSYYNAAQLMGQLLLRSIVPHYFLKVLLEPASWFLVWAALDFLFYDFAELKKERNFYKEISGRHIHFKSS